jgi:ferredoxin
MTHVVTDSCIKCKYKDCIEVCPVDCFYEGENMVVINPGECIDCGVCVLECPAEAIIPDINENAETWLEMNQHYADKWPNVTEKGEPMQGADEWQNVKGKFEKYFSSKPGPGD